MRHKVLAVGDESEDEREHGVADHTAVPPGAPCSRVRLVHAQANLGCAIAHFGEADGPAAP